MNYTPLIDEASTAKWSDFCETAIVLTVVASTIAMLVVVCLRDHVPFVKKHAVLVSVLTLIPLVGVAFGVVTFANSLEGRLETAKVENLQIMKDNLAAKYDMNVDSIVLPEGGLRSTPKGAGDYKLTQREEGTRSTFRVRFEESGEPFIHVSEAFTKSQVNKMMR